MDPHTSNMDPHNSNMDPHNSHRTSNSQHINNSPCPNNNSQHNLAKIHHHISSNSISNNSNNNHLSHTSSNQYHTRSRLLPVKHRHSPQHLTRSTSTLTLSQRFNHKQHLHHLINHQRHSNQANNMLHMGSSLLNNIHNNIHNNLIRSSSRSGQKTSPRPTTSPPSVVDPLPHQHQSGVTSSSSILHHKGHGQISLSNSRVLCTPTPSNLVGPWVAHPTSLMREAHHLNISPSQALINPITNTSNILLHSSNMSGTLTTRTLTCNSTGAQEHPSWGNKQDHTIHQTSTKGPQLSQGAPGSHLLPLVALDHRALDNRAHTTNSSSRGGSSGGHNPISQGREGRDNQGLKGLNR